MRGHSSVWDMGFSITPPVRSVGWPILYNANATQLPSTGLCNGGSFPSYTAISKCCLRAKCV